MPWCHALIGFKTLKKTSKICEIHIRLLSQISAPWTAEIQHLPVHLKVSWPSQKSWCGLQWSGELFAVFSKKTSLGFHDLLKNFNVHLEALVDLQEVHRRTKSLHPGKVATMVVEVNVYGSRDDAMLIGNFLSTLGLYLQQPVLRRYGVQYYNPHFLPMGDIDETPLFEVGSGIRMERQLRPAASHSSDPGEDDAGEEVQSILDSLSRGTVLGKRGGDSGICTVLKEYVSA